MPAYQAMSKWMNVVMFWLYLKFYWKTDRNKKKLAGLKIPEKDQICFKVVGIMYVLLQT